MSGVAGADRIRSREDYDQFVASYKKIISKFPGFESLNSSGSYNSNKAKTTFGDIDLVVHIKTPKSKVDIKKDLAQYFTNLPDTVIVPFSSPKYKGRKTYNSGEIVTVRYHDAKLGYSVQVDNIIALDKAEAVFKTSFLDLPAEKQGLILGLAKVILLEEPAARVFARMSIKAPTTLEENEEYEFNLSSIELQLRKVVYEPGSYVQQSRSVVWKSTKYTDVIKLFHDYDLDLPFEKLMAQIKSKLHNPRSKQRIAGVFSSMISVKSGEVGTEKGANKQAAIDTVRKAFGEQRMITFKEYVKESVDWYELGKMGIDVRENSHNLSGQGVAEGSLEEVDTRTLVNYVPKAGRTLASLPPEERKRRSGMMTRAYQKLIPRPDFSDEIKKYQDGKNKKQGVAEGLLDRFKKKTQQPEDPSYKKGWELCNKDPSADPQFLFRKFGGGLDRNQFMRGFNDNAESRGMKLRGDVGSNGLTHGDIKYKEFKRYGGMAEAVKGWKHAGRDLMKSRQEKSDATKEVRLVSLKKDGTESKMHDAEKRFSSEEEARQHHEKIKKLNPNRAIAHNLYVGDNVEKLS